MIALEILKEKGNIVGFRMEGHAEYGEHGSDILCSGVSAIAQTAVMGITEHLGLNVALKIDEESGIHMVLEENEERLYEANIILSTMLLGLRAIQESYGQEYLEILEREV